jgi:thioredoxin 1
MSSFRNLINREGLVLVDFHAEWCGPCKMMAPILKEVKDKLGHTITIIKIDVDKNNELANQLNIRGVPTMILYKNGKQLWRQSGLVQKENIIDVISSFS